MIFSPPASAPAACARANAAPSAPRVIPGSAMAGGMSGSPRITSISGRSRRSPGSGAQARSFFPAAPSRASSARTTRSRSSPTANSISIEQLAGIFLSLQKRGAHNINLVSPTPYLGHVVGALEIASARGLSIPLVYNTSGYERVEVVEQLEGIVDIYLPDLKYGPGESSVRLGLTLSGVRDYCGQALPALREMFRQTGPLQLDREGIAVRGMVIRHLIIPGQTENSLDVLRAMAASPFRGAWLSLMSQYFPAHLAPGRPPFDRRLLPDEYREVRDEALRLGLEEGWFQEMD